MTMRSGKDDNISRNYENSLLSRMGRSSLSSSLSALKVASSNLSNHRYKNTKGKRKSELTGATLTSVEDTFAADTSLNTAPFAVSANGGTSGAASPVVVTTTDEKSPTKRANNNASVKSSTTFSMGVGCLSPDGKTISSFVPTLPAKKSSMKSSFQSSLNDSSKLVKESQKQLSQQLQQQSRSLYNYLQQKSHDLQQKSHDAAEKLASTAAEKLASHKQQVPIIFRRSNSSFFRVADLDLPDDIHMAIMAKQSSSLGSSVCETRSIASTANSTIVSTTTDEVLSSSTTSSSNGSEYNCINNTNPASTSIIPQQDHPNFFYASVDPPPGIEHDPDEKWVALDNGAGSFAPIAPYAIQALVKTAFRSIFDDSMWVPYNNRQFKNIPWHQVTWQKHGNVKAMDIPPAKKTNQHNGRSIHQEEQEIFVWSGRFNHQFYGYDIPAVRTAAIMHMSSKELYDLLIDSSRVGEYNKYSIGREDVLILQDESNNTDSNSEKGPLEGKSVTKVMRARNTLPPLPFMKSTTIELTTLLHATELEDGSGYILVTRAVTNPTPCCSACGAGEGSDSSSSSCTCGNTSSSTATTVLRSEILMGVNVIRNVEGDNSRCLMVNVCHVRSPCVPMAIAMRMGASAASNFIKDVRTVVVAT